MIHAAKIEFHPPATLKPYERNARIHSKRQIDKLAKSIQAFGFTNPVLIDDQRGILAGHGRVLAALKLNMPEVPCIPLAHMSAAEKRAYIIADNQMAALAGLDPDILASELQAIIDTDFDPELTGFAMAEIDLTIAKSRAKKADAREMPPPALRDTVIVEPGQLWRLGDHRLVCADARDERVYARMMGDERAAMVFTDPPYNVPIDGFTGGKGAIKHREFAMASGEMTNAEFIAFLTSALAPSVAYSRDGSIHFVCMDWRHAGEVLAAGANVYDELKNRICWVKDNAGMGTFYRSQYEDIYVFKKGTAPHINNFELGQYGSSRSNIWKYPGVNTMRKGRLEELAMHPTVKPLPLVADAIKDVSRPKDIVLDPFAGSGTTLIAAEQTGRRARVVEIDPRYCDCIIRRWQAATGRAATLEDSDLTFENIAFTFVGEDAA